MIKPFQPDKVMSIWCLLENWMLIQLRDKSWLDSKKGSYCLSLLWSHTSPFQKERKKQLQQVLNNNAVDNKITKRNIYIFFKLLQDRINAFLEQISVENKFLVTMTTANLQNYLLKKYFSNQGRNKERK